MTTYNWIDNVQNVSRSILRSEVKGGQWWPWCTRVIEYASVGWFEKIDIVFHASFGRVGLVEPLLKLVDSRVVTSVGIFFSFTKLSGQLVSTAKLRFKVRDTNKIGTVLHHLIINMAEYDSYSIYIPASYLLLCRYVLKVPLLQLCLWYVPAPS